MAKKPKQNDPQADGEAHADDYGPDETGAPEDPRTVSFAFGLGETVRLPMARLTAVVRGVQADTEGRQLFRVVWADNAGAVHDRWVEVRDLAYFREEGS